MDPAEVKAIDWPKLTLGGTEYTLRLAYSARQQLFKWGFRGSEEIPLAAWAAAMAGSFDKKGQWRSAGFKDWLEVADMVASDDEAIKLSEAVNEAIKKVSPDAETTVVPAPATDAQPPATDQAS